MSWILDDQPPNDGLDEDELAQVFEVLATRFKNTAQEIREGKIDSQNQFFLSQLVSIIHDTFYLRRMPDEIEEDREMERAGD